MSHRQLAELGNALMDFIDGPHCTIIDPRREGNPQSLRAKACSLVARFEKLGRDRDSVSVAVSGLSFISAHSIYGPDGA
jgi:hypothetical protein